MFEHLSVDEFLALQPDEIAMLVLGDLQREPPWERAIIAWNYNLRIRQAARDAGASEDVAMRVGAVALEGWEWLRANGFVAEHPEQNGWEALTRAGRSTNPQIHLDEIRGLGILREANLDDELGRTVESLMVRGKYDDAVLAAMRLVEDRVRFAGHFSNSDIGVKLMRDAFRTSGPLCDPAADPGEAAALMELFVGAIGVFKNPASHRIVGNDHSQATEAVLLANTLLRLLGRAEQATRKRGRPRKRS